MAEEWRVTAFGVAGTEFTYQVEASDKQTALEEAYGRHGRRLRDGVVTDVLGVNAYAERLSKVS